MAPKRPTVEEVSQTPYPVHSDKEIDEQSYTEEEFEENENPSGESDSDDDSSGLDTESQGTVPSPTPTDFSIKMNQPSQNPSASGLKSVAKEKGKPSNGGRTLGKNKSPITRIWKVDHELETLEGLDKFQNEMGQDPCKDTRDFHEFMKKHLSINVTRDQLMNKICRLKNRYLKKAAKGENPVFSKPELKKLFEISKKLWSGVGSTAAASSVKGRKRKVVKSVSVNDLISKERSGDKRAKKSVEAEKSMALVKVRKEVVVEGGFGSYDGEGLKGDQEGFWDKYPRFKESLDKENPGYFSKCWKRAMELIGVEEAREMEGKWKEFQAREAELVLFRLKLVAEQTELMLDAMRAAKQ